MADHIDVYSETARIMPERESVETAKIVAGRITHNNPSHMLGTNDFDNPMNWPTHRKVYASAVAWAMAFTVAFGLTSCTAGIPQIMQSFETTMTQAIAGFSLYLFGIFFAPIYTPHLSERFGRSIIYLAAIFICGLFHLGAALSQSYTSLSICRFCAGFAGGPCLVLIEGTFADIWDAETTNTYYAFLGVASYYGAASGPIVGNFVVQAGSWRWSEYTTLLLTLLVFAFGIGMPETYGREILRRRNKARSLALPGLPPAESGITVRQMATVTIITPLKQLVLEPIVMMISFTLALNWALTFQWFITVPIVLQTVYGFSPERAGLAFIGAIGGASIAAMCTIAIEQFIYRSCKATKSMPIEKRLFTAMYGGVLMTGSIFWVGWTADPTIHYLSPIFGTAVFIWGGLSVLISLVTYLFDAYPPAGTLSALTAAACTRIAAAGIIPLVIVPAFIDLGGNWALSIFGFISIPCIAVPFVLYRWGPALRARSPYTKRVSIHSHMPVMMEMERMESESNEREGMRDVHV